jgi:HD-GYP domain-containing protein (c-di-GMP phosphodiesterase class II)
MSAEQVPLVLQSVQESLRADLTCWYPGGDPGAETWYGPGSASAGWRAQIVARLRTEDPNEDGRAICPLASKGPWPADPVPTSVALMRVSKSRGSWLAAFSLRDNRSFNGTDLKIMKLARRMLLNHRQQAQTYERLKDSLLGLVRCLTAAIDAKDPYTWGHSERVARIAVRLGQQMGLPPATLNDLYLAGLLHDIGKIGVRDSVLQKPGELTAEEFAHIKQHAIIGDRLISNMRSLEHLRPGVRNHHERYDGKGYPDHLVGEAIPLVARVLSVADACDAMMAARPYRPSLSTARIEAVLSQGAGTQWDPRVIDCFLTCRDELYSICQRGLGDSVFAAVERALTARDDDSSRRRSLAAAPGP